MKMTTSGSDLSKFTGSITKATREATRESLWKLGGEIIERAKELVPVDTGELRASGYVGQVETKGAEASSLTVGFFAPHAREQEENESYSHRVGQAHYLRDATIEVAGDALPLVRRELADFIRREVK